MGEARATTGNGNAGFSEQRFIGLDGLRGFAVAMVVWHNFGPLPGLSRLGRAAALPAGYVGVTLFFVLSGFLISYLLLDEIEGTGAVGSGRIRLAAFYVRRAYRLFPALGLTLSLLVAMNIHRHHAGGDTLRALISSVGYVFNFVAQRSSPLQPLGGAGWGHLWSLSVEEQFYVVWPLVLSALALRISRRRLLFALCVTALAVSGWRTELWWDGASMSRLYLLTDARVDSLLIGAALAVALRGGWLRRLLEGRAWMVWPALVVLLVLADQGSGADPAASPGWLLGPGMLLVSLVSALIVGAVVCGQRSPATALLSTPLPAA